MDFHIKGIDHVVLRTADIQKCLDFYVGVLGCKLVMRFEEIGLHQIHAGASIIDVFDCGKNPPIPGDHQRLHHFALQLGWFDRDQIVAHLDAHGVKHGDERILWGAEGRGPALHLWDPDGNMVELKGPPTSHRFDPGGTIVEMKRTHTEPLPS